MPIQVISGTTPANTGQLATPATTNFSLAFISASYGDTYVSSSLTASLRSAAITAFNVEGVNVVFYTGSVSQSNTPNTIFINNFPFNTANNTFAASASAVFNTTASVQNSATTYSSLQGITSTVSTTNITFSVGETGSYDDAYNLNTQYTAISGSTTLTFSGASMYGPAGSGIVTGSFSQIFATADASLTISGSAIGVAGFVLPRGATFTTGSGLIQAITVNNPQGTVVAS